MVVERERDGWEGRNGERGRDDFSLGVFYIPPELVWNQQQVAHARTSLAHSVITPVASRG